MSQYPCPDCGSDSKVVDTRPSYKRLRRRRACLKSGHKFTTHEVPSDATEKIDEIIDFIVSNAEGQEDDMIEYGQAQLREILLGIEEE